jgi:hypothetical protein
MEEVIQSSAIGGKHSFEQFSIDFFWFSLPQQLQPTVLAGQTAFLRMVEVSSYLLLRRFSFIPRACRQPTSVSTNWMLQLQIELIYL